MLNAIYLCYVPLQEFSLEKAMQTMVHVWDGISFHHQPYRETGVSILTALDEIQTMLDDQIVKTQTMRGSPFIKPFENEIKVMMIMNKCRICMGILPDGRDLTICSVTLAVGGAPASYPGNHR